MTERTGQPRILVFGAGSVGALLGGVLANVGCDVTLLGRAVTGEAIRRHGLQVELPGRSFKVRPRYVQHIGELDVRPDIVLLTTRSYSVRNAIPQLKQVMWSDPVLISLQNGVGTEELISGTLPGIRHVAGSLTLSAEWTGPGQVASTSRSGGIALAPVSADLDIREIAGLFTGSGFPVTTLNGYRSMKWSKLLLNMMANAVPAILDWSPANVYEHPLTFKIEHAALMEAIRVIQAERSELVSLPGFPVSVLPWLFRFPESIVRQILLSRVRGGRGGKMPSLLLDLRAGRTRTEARWLYGAIADAGEAVGTPTPVNRRLLRVMEGVTKSPELREAFRNQPELLVRNVALGISDNTSEAPTLYRKSR